MTSAPASDGQKVQATLSRTACSSAARSPRAFRLEKRPASAVPTAKRTNMMRLMVLRAAK